MKILQRAKLQDIMLPKDFDTGTGQVKHLRSVFRFKMLCCTSFDSLSLQRTVVNGMKVEWKAFITNELLPVLQGVNKGVVPGFDAKIEGEAWPMRVYFDGEGIKEVEVMQTLTGDLWLACGSMGFVLFYLIVHTRSVLLSIFSLLIVILSVPLSYVASASITGSQELHVASFLSLFLIVGGLGSDVVFVFTDYWRSSGSLVKNCRDPTAPKVMRVRLTWTLYHAGKASLATSA
eukprot:CAMPEP_0177548560 /NCGR_PEP_ID=MMETSP0369-20130122/64522_1 /TAXON_ID=447022 ORGANISM="Scrippsiella hangoei-like, Strain SHHI-4" /NCGR_SAMPLE_ID=MMETSP0369 /ASSEMBLY_ACC=CAM_ASM_000364 /LENGTH=232 /DNA_ID=CAMNT_0019033539 /DNA_START=23 /DNA_END=718 /DNA_ORIENTATION=-